MLYILKIKYLTLFILLTCLFFYLLFFYQLYKKFSSFFVKSLTLNLLFLQYVTKFFFIFMFFTSFILFITLTSLFFYFSGFFSLFNSTSFTWTLLKTINSYKLSKTNFFSYINTSSHKFSPPILFLPLIYYVFIFWSMIIDFISLYYIYFSNYLVIDCFFIKSKKFFSKF